MSIDPARRFGGATMGTRWSVTIDDPVSDAVAMQIQDQCQAAADLVDCQMSTWKPDSDLMRLNTTPVGSWVPLPPAILTVLAAGLDISRQTDGAFEMNIGDAVRAWGFGTAPLDLTAIKTASTGQRIRATDALELGDGQARCTAPLTLDLSGIAKGFGVDRLTEAVQSLGIAHALCSIDGEVRALGTRRDGQPWTVGIDAPDDAQRGTHSRVTLANRAVATSGDYRHFVTVRTTRLSHTMDPNRGAPRIDAPASVTVLAATCMAADAMATALTVMGAAKGADFARHHGIDALILQRGADGLIAFGTGVFAA